MTLQDAMQLAGVETQKELADLLEIEPPAISQWDKEKIPLLREYQVRELAAKREQCEVQHAQA